MPAEPALGFGPYLVYPATCSIVENGRPLRLGRRAFALLLVLLENAGQVVSKRELLDRVWPCGSGEEGNLRVHMAALRKALGDGQEGRRYIVTVALRGYSFVAPTRRVGGAPPLPIAVSGRHNLPPRRSRLLGREGEVAQIVGLLQSGRCISVVGCGGIGKTSVALQAAEQLIDRYRDGVRMLDLTLLQDAGPLSSMLAALLGVPGQAGSSLEAICAQLGEREMLLLIDNCEHLIEAAAHLVECVLRAAPKVRVLSTSREELRVAHEQVYRLSPLASPPRQTAEVAAALAYPALALLVERVRNVDEAFEPRAADLPRLVEICHRLDGMPLAIELAAGQIAAEENHDLALLDGDSYLDRPIEAEPAHPRHRHLRALFDWSYALLPAVEQASLRRLGVFRGSFTLESAAVMLGLPGDPGAGCMLIAHLASKSLISVEASDDEFTYRLLEPIRLYALEQLEAAGELHETRVRHLGLCLARLECAQREWESLPTERWLARHSRWLGDLRSALNWGLDDEVRHPLAIRLAACSAPIWQEMSLLHEYGAYVTRALGLLGATSYAQTDDALRLATQLELALGNCSYHGQVVSSQAIGAFQSARLLAQRTGDAAAVLHAISGQVAASLRSGQYLQTLALSEEFDQLAQGHGDELAVSSQRLRVLALHFSGRQTQAQSLAEEVLATLERENRANRFALCMGVQYEQRVASLTVLARILWLRGYPEQAERRVQQALDLAFQLEHTPSISYSLATAGCVIAHYNGEYEKAASRLRQLFEAASRHSIPLFADWAQHYAGVMRCTGLPLPTTPASGLVRDIVMTLGGSQELASQRAGSSATGWCAPEWLRIEACQLLERGSEGGEAESLLSRALELARRSGALAWELRCATTLARLWRDQGLVAPAREMLASVYARFEEGFATPDLKAARECLATLG
ncbi:winged helix-turn-helix domain-containing protein [Pseudomonas sp. QL9]|uniref:ATP-binding protein n=1 Tax=Pseudomonas sp. QL9 TaxID=3242725 RepID=UPI00352A21C7